MTHLTDIKCKRTKQRLYLVKRSIRIKKMIDGVILLAVLVPAIIGMFSLMVSVINETGGTKGITQPYITKSGRKHTAKKERSNYIV